jgi:tetratricopeptide (TPR) repeat protein
MKESLVISIFLSIFLILCMGLAQLSDEAEAALNEGKTAAAEALNRYAVPNPDQELWKLALEYGKEAERLAPDHPAPQRFLAQVYSTLGWYKRAWDSWQKYEANGGVLDEEAALKYSEMSVAMGYLSYQQGQPEEALRYYQQANILQSDNDEALIWIALLYFELEQPEQALTYWQKVVERQPDNPRYLTYLEQTQSQLEYGIEASKAFYEGVEAYGNGEQQIALDNFAKAAQLNPTYSEALIRAGTLSLELENPRAAVNYWQRVLELKPDDTEAQASLELAQLQTQWGVAAVNHVQTGLMFLEQENLTKAISEFLAATKANPRYAAAWAWLGRLEATLGNDERAQVVFERAIELEPENSSYTNAYAEVQQRLDERAQVEQELHEEEEASQEAGVESAEASSPVAETPASQELTARALNKIAVLQSQAESERIRTFIQPSRTQDAPPDVEKEETIFAPPLVLLETTYTHRAADGELTPFIFFESSKAVQANLTTPTNYANGRIYQRLEVLQKPSSVKVHYQFCLVPDDDITISPACSEIDALGFTSTGVYEMAQPLASFTDYTDVNWSKGISEFILVLRDSYGDPISNESSTANEATFDLDMFYPMKIRYTAVLVPEGGTFSGWPEGMAFEP